MILDDLLRRHWGLHDVAVTALGGGMNSQTWLVTQGSTAYVAKVVAASASGDLATGCQVAARLADAGLVTGRPVPTVDGRLSVAEHGLALLERVAGRELDGGSPQEQRWMAESLARVHVAGDPSPGQGTASFYEWLSPSAPGVSAHPWLASAIHRVRVGTDPLAVTWSTLHTDPAPEAFLRDERLGVTGLIDWAGAGRGPVLYDVASAVMYLGGPAEAAAFLEAYAARGPLEVAELRHLDAFRAFRWAVQGAYFAGRQAAGDLTGIADERENEGGLARARRGLAELGVPG